jgi:hypothetical protein
MGRWSGAPSASVASNKGLRQRSCARSTRRSDGRACQGRGSGRCSRWCSAGVSTPGLVLSTQSMRAKRVPLAREPRGFNPAPDYPRCLSDCLAPRPDPPKHGCDRFSRRRHGPFGGSCSQVGRSYWASDRRAFASRGDQPPCASRARAQSRRPNRAEPLGGAPTARAAAHRARRTRLNGGATRPGGVRDGRTRRDRAADRAACRAHPRMRGPGLRAAVRG